MFPEFDEVFRGYGFNKRAHSIELQKRGWKFLVEAGGAFLVHRYVEVIYFGDVWLGSYVLHNFFYVYLNTHTKKTTRIQ